MREELNEKEGRRKLSDEEIVQYARTLVEDPNSIIPVSMSEEDKKLIRQAVKTIKTRRATEDELEKTEEVSELDDKIERARKLIALYDKLSEEEKDLLEKLEDIRKQKEEIAIGL